MYQCMYIYIYVPIRHNKAVKCKFLEGFLSRSQHDDFSKNLEYKYSSKTFTL